MPGKTIDLELDPDTTVKLINNLREKVERYKSENNLKKGFINTYEGVLNAYREGDITFKQAVSYLDKIAKDSR